MKRGSRDRSPFTHAAVTAAALAVLLITPHALAMHPNHPVGFSPERAYQAGATDSIDLYSGTLSLTIPIGPFTLAYNSQVWTYEFDENGKIEANPDAERNAGIGWKLGWGEVYHPNSAYNDTERWMFVDQNGSRHVFYDRMHQNDPDDGDPDVFYTRDSSYLRMTKYSGTWYVDIEYPDGTTRRYKRLSGAATSTHRFERAWNRFGSPTSYDLKVEYPNAPDATHWKMTDRYGRIHHVYLDDQYTALDLVVTQVDIESFNGQRALYDFTYSSQSIRRSCKDDSPNTSNWVTVPLLERIDLPGGTSYDTRIGGQLQYYSDCAVADDASGILTEITLPTGGRLAWDFQEYVFPPNCQSCPFSTGAGVDTKYTKLPDGTVEGAWTYKTTKVPQSGSLDPEMVTEVVYPTGDCTKHYFNAIYWTDPGAGLGWEISLPFTKRAAEQGGRKLSVEVFETSSGRSCPASGPVRSTYVEYDHDILPGSGGQRNFINSNRRIKGSRTVFHDDDDTWTDTAYSDFDGIGHFRKAETTGNLWTGGQDNERRVVTTNYNRVSGSYPSNNPPGLTDPWVLNVFDYVHTWEPDGHGKVTSRIYYTFDMNTGFLECTRVLGSGTVRGPDDVLVKNIPDSLGLVTEVKTYGGDVQALATGTGCPDEQTVPEYWTKHTYENGVRKTSRPYEPDGDPGPFYTYDVDLDSSTGLVTASRDAAGFKTMFSYDILGRPEHVTPDEGAEFVYSYINPSGNNGAEVRIDTDAGAGTLTSSEVHFDAFGRAVKERRKMPDGTWSERVTEYNPRGWKTSVSEWGNTSLKTQFLSFDPFGRATIVRPPDGSNHDLRFTFKGVREVTSEAKIQLAGAESYVPTIREYDAHGRLRKVIEKSAPPNPRPGPNEDAETTYEYDVGKRLTKIASGVQTREFDYDNRGFSNWELHPEKGSLPVNDDFRVYRYDFDSKGLPRRTLDGPNSLEFEYDFIGRLTTIKDLNASSAVLTSLQYDSGLGKGMGKLWKAVQHNRIELPWSELPLDDVTVTETYAYEGKAGAVSSRNTLVQGLALAVGGSDQSFDVDYVYDDLGNISELSYPTCTNPNCSATTLAGRDVDYVYSQGLLSEVVGWTSTTPIEYWETGAFEAITHSNGVVDNQVLDPNVRSRPKKLHTTNVVNNEGWGSGDMSYDGAGNIIQMARAGVTNTFTYDEVSRVVDASVEGWLESYQYDTFGNIEYVLTTEPGQTGVAYDPNIDDTTNRIVESVGTDYDAAGNMTLSSLSYSYDWNPLNQLERQVNPSNRQWFHIYTADGERLVTIDWWEGVVSRQAVFTLRGLGNQVLSQFELVGLDQSGNWSRERDYVYAGSRLLASDDESGSGEAHYHLDHLGTPRLLTDAAGARVSGHDYLPYGAEITTVGTDVMKFTGHERDLDTGHDYMHARYYHEYLVRFLSIDPKRGLFQIPQSHNRYSYVTGRPLSYVDPDGKQSGFGLIIRLATKLGQCMYQDDCGGIPGAGLIPDGPVGPADPAEVFCSHPMLGCDPDSIDDPLMPTEPYDPDAPVEPADDLPDAPPSPEEDTSAPGGHVPERPDGRGGITGGGKGCFASPGPCGPPINGSVGGGGTLVIIIFSF